MKAAEISRAIATNGTRKAGITRHEAAEWSRLTAAGDRRPQARRFAVAGDPMHLAEIGEALGISRERVRQVEANAIGNFLEAGGSIEGLRCLRDAIAGELSPLGLPPLDPIPIEACRRKRGVYNGGRYEPIEDEEKKARKHIANLRRQRKVARSKKKA